MFRTKGRRGSVVKRITVSSNDPDTPKLFLSLKGTVIQDLTAKPGALSFGEVPVGESAVKTVALALAEPEKVQIGAVRATDERFVPKLLPGDAPGASVLEVTFVGGDKQERLTGDVTVELKGDNVVPTQIPVRVNVVGNIRFPRRIYLMKTGGRYNTREIVLTSRSGKPFKVLRAVDADKRLRLKVPKGAASEIRLTASVNEAKEKDEASQNGTIEIYTTDALDSQISVDYTISNRDRLRDLRKRVSKARREKGDPTSLKPAKGADRKPKPVD